MSTMHTINRRQCDRFTLTPMYTRVTIQRVADHKVEKLVGHAYDISETGIRIELDCPLEAGERVALDMGLPGEDIDIYASAQVVWVNETEDDPGPRRCALVFREFISDSDRRRLHRFLGSGLCHRAA